MGEVGVGNYGATMAYAGCVSPLVLRLDLHRYAAAVYFPGHTGDRSGESDGVTGADGPEEPQVDGASVVEDAATEMLTEQFDGEGEGHPAGSDGALCTQGLAGGLFVGELRRAPTVPALPSNRFIASWVISLTRGGSSSPAS